jgi:hypothetical protein
MKTHTGRGQRPLKGAQGMSAPPRLTLVV